MPVIYPLEVVREACALYRSGLSMEDVAERMRRKGHKAFNAETIRRWTHKYGLVEDHVKATKDSVNAALMLESQCATNELLEVSLNARKAVTKKLSSGGIASQKAVRLLNKIDALILDLVDANMKP